MSIRAIVGSAAAVCVAAASFGQSISVVLPLPGSGVSVQTPINGLSGDGLVGLGQQTWPGQSGIAAIRWTSGAGTQQMPSDTFFRNANASAANFDGSVIVGSDTINGYTRAVRWTGGAPIPIVPVNVNVNSTAYDVTSDGLTIVGMNGGQPFRWTQAGGLVTLPMLPGVAQGIAVSITPDASVIVGLHYDPAGGTRAVRWTGGGSTPQNLGLLGGGSTSYATDVSADGATVIGVAQGADLQDHAFIWNAAIGGPIVQLPQLAGTTASSAAAITQDGSMIVGSSTVGGQLRATMWTTWTGVVDLNAYLPTQGVNLTGWQLFYAQAVSDDGSVIAGIGNFNGAIRGFVVSGLAPTPTPGAGALLLLGGLAAARRRR